MRAAEGAALERDLRARLARVASSRPRSRSARGEVGRRRRASGSASAREQLAAETGLLDEARLHQEIVIAADRMDVTEELVRLRSHVAQFRGRARRGRPGRPVGPAARVPAPGDACARSNTIGSKAGDAPIAHRVVELKTELERMREQVQNVE